MIFGQLSQKSPQNKQKRNVFQETKKNPVCHMLCSQLSKLKIHYDDITYNKKEITKIIILVTVINCDKKMSPKGYNMINVRVKDSTGTANLSFYYDDYYWQILSQKDRYVKIFASLKCGGLVYRPEIKIMGNSVTILDDYDQITSHCLQVVLFENDSKS